MSILGKNYGPYPVPGLTPVLSEVLIVLVCEVGLFLRFLQLPFRSEG